MPVLVATLPQLAPPGPVVLASDTLTATGTLGAPNWTALLGTITTNGFGGFGTTASAWNIAVWSTAAHSFAPDQWVRATVARPPTTLSGAGICLRVAGGASYMLRIGSTSCVVTFSVSISSANTNTMTIAGFPYTPHNNTELAMDVVGDVLRCWLDGVLIFNGVPQIYGQPTPVYASGQPGIACYNSAGGTGNPPNLVNWEAGEGPLEPVQLALTTTTLPDATVGVPYSAQLTASNGMPPYTYTAQGAIPSWMHVSSAGTISGTPDAASYTVVNFAVQDLAGATATSNTPGTTVTWSGILLYVNQATQQWFGAYLPVLPEQFSTVCAPPAPAATNRGSYYTPGVAPDAALTVQQAINAAAAAPGTLGDVIVLQAGTPYTTTSSWNLPVRVGSGWIYLISSHAPEVGGVGLPPAGTRVKVADISHMASLRSSATNNPYLLVRSGGAGVNQYRLVGIDLQLLDSNGTGPGSISYVVTFGNSDTQLATLARNITFDRCYVAGAPNWGTNKGISLEGAYMEVTECRIERVWQLGNGDSNAIFMGNSTGPFKIHNNYLSADGETILTGGNNILLPAPTNPGDLTITNNHIFKNVFNAVASIASGSTTLTVSAITGANTGTQVGEIRPLMVIYGLSLPTSPVTVIKQQLTSDEPGGALYGRGTYALNNAATATSTDAAISGYPFGKNMIEFKLGERVLIDHNYLENAGATGQARSGFLLTARNQNGLNPWVALRDFTITNNVLTNAPTGAFNNSISDGLFPGTTGGQMTQIGKRYLIRNNLLIVTASQSVNHCPFSWGANMTGPNGAGMAEASDLIFDHNTFVGPVTGNIWAQFNVNGSPAPALQRFHNCVWSNSLWDPTTWGGMAKNFNPGATYAATVPTQVTQPAFINNVLLGSGDTTVPTGNFRPGGGSAAVGFTNYGSPYFADGYALTTASPWHGVGVEGLGAAYNAAGTPDGTDIGCDISKLPVLPP